MKHDRDGKESLPDPERDGIDAEEDDLADSVADRERLFSEVEPEGGRGVHVAVHVVHEVEAPEEGNDVVDAMPDPECVIEQHDGESDLDGPGEVHEVQYSEMSLLAPLGRRDEKGGLQIVTTASEMPPAVRLRATRRGLDSRCLRSGLRVSRKSRTRKAIAVAAAP